MPRALVAGVESAPANFDMEQPAAFGDSVGSDISSSVYEQLTGPRPLLGTDGVWRVDWSDLEAQLAEGWWFSPDGRTCTFRLRPGVRSADGNELTAEDVRWSWERSFGVRDVGKWVARISSVQEATDVEVVDPLTVAFHLRAPNPALPRTMAQGTPNVYDSRVARAGQSPEDPWASSLLGARPSGFGPYRLVRADGESLTEIEANPHYHGGPPPIGEVVARRYPSTEEAIQALLQGDVDLVPGVPWSALSRVRSERRLRITPAASTAGVFLHLDPGAEPLDDPRVRQAIAHATPYRAVLQTAYAGTAERWYSWVKPESPGYDPASWPYEEDVGRARALLASSKGAGGFSTSIVVLPGEVSRWWRSCSRSGSAGSGSRPTSGSSRAGGTGRVACARRATWRRSWCGRPTTVAASASPSRSTPTITTGAPAGCGSSPSATTTRSSSTRCGPSRRPGTAPRGLRPSGASSGSTTATP